MLLLSMVPAVAGAQPDVASSTARLRLTDLVAMVPPAEGFRLTVDGEAIAASVGFGASSAYVTLPAGRHHVQISDSTSGATVLTTTARMVGGQAYTYQVAGRLDGTLVAWPATDDARPAAGGLARVRFGNAIPNDLDVQARLKGSTAMSFKQAAFAGLSSYQDVPAGTYTLEIASSEGQLLLSVPNVALSAGGVYTLFCTGLNTASTATAAAQAGTVVVSSAQGSDVAGAPDISLPAQGTPGGPSWGSFQLVDVAPGALVDGPVSLVLDGQTTVGAVGFGGVTAGIPMAPGEHHVQVYRAAGGAPLVDTTITMQKNVGYSYVLYQGPGNTAGGALAQARSAPVGGTVARVRFANASAQGRSLRASLTGAATFVTTTVGSVTGYADVPAGHYGLQITAPDGAVASSAPEVTLSGGQTYILVAIDQPGGRGGEPILAFSPAGSQLITVPDPPTPTP
jgi:hypothetical protein